MNLEQFKLELHDCIEKELCAWKFEHNETLVSFDFGVYPWYGYFELSFLTKEELQKYGNDFRYDIGDWKYYNFNQFQEHKSKKIYELGQWMKKYYDDKKNPDTGDVFFEICSYILIEKNIIDCFNSYPLSKDFMLTVYNPDDSDFTNYYVKNTI